MREDSLPLLQKRTDYLDDYTTEEGLPCGISSGRVFSKRIIGGKQANFGEFPWQAHIKIGTFQCGGVLGKRNIHFRQFSFMQGTLRASIEINKSLMFQCHGNS